MVNLAADMAEGRLRRHVPTHIYYRQPNGWITSGLASQIEQARFVAGGWTPLPQYGRFDILYEYIGDHPLEVLFIRGGAKELLPEQIIESGFWMNPPVIPSCGIALNPEHTLHSHYCWVNKWTVEFPQVPSDTPRSLDCRFCERKLPTTKARDQHEGVMHWEEKGELRTGDALATSLVKGLAQSGVLIQTPPSTGVGGKPTVSSLPYVCGYCGDGFKSPVALGKHVKKEHKSGGQEG